MKCVGTALPALTTVSVPKAGPRMAQFPINHRHAESTGEAGYPQTEAENRRARKARSVDCTAEQRETSPREETHEHLLYPLNTSLSSSHHPDTSPRALFLRIFRKVDLGPQAKE